ncbi:MAG: hypothetical protein ABR530_03075 [Pyrinomonadaceae bacterium]
MRSGIFTLLTIVLLLAGLTGCGGSAPANSTAGNGAPGGNSNDPLGTTAKTPVATSNEAPTLTPVFKAYCEAVTKKDEAAIRKAYSSDTIKDFESQMKEDKIRTLVKFLEDEMPGDTCSVRNEEIKSDSAIAEIKTGAYPSGIRVLFVKENGEWKLTNKAPDIETTKKSTAAANDVLANTGKKAQP